MHVVLHSGVLAGGPGGHGPPSEYFLGAPKLKGGAKIDQKR